MARSDNVVRVALTPKYRDVPLLCEMLTYKMGAPPIVPPCHVSPCCTRFTPPVADFELEVHYTVHTPICTNRITAFTLSCEGSLCSGSGELHSTTYRIVSIFFAGLRLAHAQVFTHSTSLTMNTVALPVHNSVAV
jgi:mannose-6-phosphate isomerase class I